MDDETKMPFTIINSRIKISPKIFKEIFQVLLQDMIKKRILKILKILPKINFCKVT